MSKCDKCNCNIYFENKIDGMSPGTNYKDKVYCIQCLEGEQFLENMIIDNNQESKSQKELPSKPTSQLLLDCPFCKNTLQNNKSICSNCNKTHPLFIRKTKKRKNRRNKKK